MTWQRLGLVIAGWCVFDAAAVLVWMGWLSYATRRNRRVADRPTSRDDTWLRFERTEWNPTIEGKFQ